MTKRIGFCLIPRPLDGLTCVDFLFNVLTQREERFIVYTFSTNEKEKNT